MLNRRSKFRSDLRESYIPFYDALCTELHEEWQPYSGTRTFQAQDLLYAQGRTSPGGIVTNARGGESAHCYGCANDWTLWTPDGEPIWMNKEDERWQIFVAAVTKVGLRPGAEFGDIDHCELKIACSWVHIAGIYRLSGIEAAGLAIDQMLAATPLGAPTPTSAPA